MRTRLAAHALGQWGVQPQAGLLHATAIALHVQQAEGGRGLLHIGQHAAEEPLVRLGRHALASLRHKAPEGHGHRQLGRTALLKPQHLLQQQVQRDAVHHQVVTQQLQQPAALPGIVRGPRPYHRRLPHVQAQVVAAQLLQHLRHQCLMCLMCLIRIRPLQLQRCLTQHHLHGLGQPLPEHGRAQDVMARNHLIEAMHEGLQLLARPEAQQVGRDEHIAPDCSRWWNRIPSCSGASG